jgi:hypothetical protein
MNRLRSYLIGLFIGIAGFASAQNLVPFFQGPVDPAQMQSYLNTLVNVVNNEVAGYLTFGNPNENGALALNSANSFAANGSVGTSVTSLGPTGSHTTIQEWLIVYDNNGTKRWAPLY